MSAKHSNGTGVPAATYIRMSSDKQDASPEQQLVVGDAEAVSLVRRMFAECLAGHSLRGIAIRLNAECLVGDRRRS